MSNDQYPADQFGQNPQSQPSAVPAWQPSATDYSGQQAYGQPSAVEYSGQIPQGNYGQSEQTGQIPMMGYGQQPGGYPMPPKQDNAFTAFSDMNFTRVFTPLLAKITWISIIIAAFWMWLVRMLTHFAHLKSIMTRTYSMKKDADGISMWALFGGIGEGIIGLSVVAAVIFSSRIILEFLVRWHQDKDAASTN